MQSYEKLADAIPRIITEAAKNQLGILALLIILLGILAYFFFCCVKLTPKNTRLILISRLFAFLLIFSGACAFGWAVVQTQPLVAAPKAPAPANAQKEKPLPIQHHDEPMAPPSDLRPGSSVTKMPVPAGFLSEIARAAVLAGKYNVPGNPAQACESYASALHLVHASLTPNELDLLRTHESACSQGRSDEHVTVLREIAQQFEARNNIPNH